MKKKYWIEKEFDGTYNVLQNRFDNLFVWHNDAVEIIESDIKTLEEAKEKYPDAEEV